MLRLIALLSASLLQAPPVFAENLHKEQLVNTFEAIVNESYVPINEQDLLREGITGLVQSHLKGENPQKVLFRDGENPAQLPEKWGLGVALERTDHGGLLRVVIDKVFPGGAAAEADLRVRDEILEVGGAAVAAMSGFEQVIDHIVGLPNSTVCLKIKRQKEISEICAARKKVVVPRMSTRLLHMNGSNFGIIDIARLEKEHAGTDFNQALQQLENAQARVAVLDFRNNEEAELEAGVRFMEQLLPAGTPLFNLRSKKETTTFKAAGERKAKRSFRFIALCSAHAGGMVEVLTRILQKHYKVTVVGEETAGYALMTQLVSIGNGYSVLVRKAEIMDTDGKTTWHGKKIKPDIFVADFNSIHITEPKVMHDLLEPLLRL